MPRKKSPQYLKIQVPEYPKYYVDILGNVYGYKGILKPIQQNNGYTHITMYRDSVPKQTSVHRLIATIFIPNPENKTQINHKNGIKNDNRVENLEWVTASENTLHALDNGLQNTRGRNHPMSKLTEDDILVIRDLKISGFRASEIAKMYTISNSNIHDIINGRIWSHVI